MHWARDRVWYLLAKDYYRMLWKTLKDKVMKKVRDKDSMIRDEALWEYP